MKVNEILDKITLKLPGGGNLPLKKYAPYIINSDEEVEGLNNEEDNKLKLSMLADIVPEYCCMPIENDVIDDLMTIDEGLTDLVDGELTCLYKKSDFDESDFNSYSNNNYGTFIDSNKKIVVSLVVTDKSYSLISRKLSDVYYHICTYNEEEYLYLTKLDSEIQ